ncbi:Olfactory receptor 2T7 [Heterocephalus glaber]|uniref:Olfactory receptor 2T7 n=1 Tax=Heterocephalus glaber TaxID=10181 RepID=G5B077_HETGA|nr:Olfactory receptor 2T7 [Heterocephalus glaber]
MCMAKGRQKAMTTCSSHIVVVSLFYRAVMFTYVVPHSYHMPEQDKTMFTFYTILMPMLNLLIYSLRKKDLDGAKWKALGQCLSLGKMTAF